MKKMSTWLFIAALAVAGSNVVGQESTAAGRGLEVEADIEVFPQLGHSNYVGSVAFGPGGKTVVSGSRDNTLKLWDTATGRELFTLRHSKEVNTVAFSPDGKTIVSGSHDETLKLWDAATGRELRTFEHRSIVQAVAFSPDGCTIVSGSGYTLSIWNVATGKLIRTLSGHSSFVNSVAVSPDGKAIVSGSRDKTLKLWDIETGREIRTISGHSDYVNSVAFSPDGKTILSSAGTNTSHRDPNMKLWDVVTGHLIHTFSPGNVSVKSAAFSPDGKTAVSASSMVKLWDIATGREIFSVPNAAAAAVAFSPDGKTILFSDYNFNLQLLDAVTGQKISTFAGGFNWVDSVAFSPDGKTIVSSFRPDVHLWDTVAGRILHTYPGKKGYLPSPNFSPNGKIVLFRGNRDDSEVLRPVLRLLDVTTGRILHTISTGYRFLSAFSPDGRTIISDSTDKTLKLWDATTGRELRTLSGHTGQIDTVAFSPDGRTIVSGSMDKTMKLWDAATGREIRTISGHSDDVNSVAFSPDGKLLVSGSKDKTIKLWDVTTGRVLRTITLDKAVFRLAFSPDGVTVSNSTSNGESHLWNMTTYEEIVLHGSPNLDQVAFSPDGKTIVTSAGPVPNFSETTLKLWKAATGELIRVFSGHTGRISSISFSPDGKTIISGSYDGTVRLWNTATGKEIARFINFSGSDTQIASATRGLTVETETAAASIDGEWLAMTPEGYYQASPQGDRYINVRVGNTVSGIDAYRSVLYNPDVVQARLAGKPDPASKGTVTIQQAASFLPPTVTIRSPESNTATGSSTTTLSVAIADQNQPIQNIKIMVNGRILGREELSAVKGTGLEPQKASYTVTGNQKTVDFQLPLSLDPGPNRIEVVAFNGFSESRRYADLTWNAPAGQRPALPNLWILAVGVNSYADSSIRNLNYCVADAKSVVDSLKAQEGKRYGKVNSLLIADGEGLAPTAANIRQNLGFLEGAGPRDVALLFLAGHGVSGSAGAFFFLPTDTRLNADSTVNPATAVTGAELFAALDAPGNRLVFIDACQSGGVDNDRLVRYLMDTNAFVFASSRGNELSQERPEFGHGVFTYSILNAIKGATAARAEGNVSVLSLSGFVSTDVPRITDDRQHPSAYSLGFYDFPLAAAP